jgi:diadenosine hexaphosphate hydrolase (ATP-forming)
VREVFEEGGVTARIERDLHPTEYTNPRGEARRIHWFLMRTSSLLATPEPGFEAGFFPLKDALEKLTHPETRALLLEAAVFLTAPVQE